MSVGAMNTARPQGKTIGAAMVGIVSTLASSSSLLAPLSRCWPSRASPTCS